MRPYSPLVSYQLRLSLRGSVPASRGTRGNAYYKGHNKHDETNHHDIAANEDSRVARNTEEEDAQTESAGEPTPRDVTYVR